jgi:opacity protein-like surface antigen
VAGLGVEYAFAPNWSANVEYLFTKYGNSSVMLPHHQEMVIPMGSSYSVRHLRPSG